MTAIERTSAPVASVGEVHEPASDAAATFVQLRAGVLALASGVFVLAMGVVSALIVGSGMTPAASVLVIAVVGAAAACAVVRVAEAVLRRADRLGTLSIGLTALYDRARLDAIRDGLTGLGNHRAFQEELDRAIEMLRRHAQPTALLLIDVDDLKLINDTNGHEAGDELLQDVARVIVHTSRRSDRAFRIGGDEFAVLSQASSTEDALVLGRRILAAALDAERAPGRPPISLTIGISAVPEPSADRKQLYRHADAALYWGKRHGRTDVRVYDPAVHGIADDERPSEELALAVDRLIANRRLTAAYQPVFALGDGTCVGFEGLIRPAPDAGFRNPTALFVAAEAVSRTVELDVAAIREIAAGSRSLERDRYLAVNLSPRTLESDAFNPLDVLGILDGAGIGSNRVVVELTEREAVEDMAQLARNLNAFRQAGVRIAADDVGAGNAGLQLLSRIDFDVIKIDMSLVQTGTVLGPSRSVLRALIDMAHRRGATTVAEGIETPLHLEIVRELGIYVGQGYLLGRPLSVPRASHITIATLLAPPPEAPSAPHVAVRQVGRPIEPSSTS
jgi:diguanylate cyclase (GGDEF)-like protein